MAIDPSTHRLDGMLLLDKPTAMSSNLALQKAKRLIGAKKAGHTGTLDPLATGLLPICLGQATKFSRFLLADDKAYDVTLTMGAATDTGDAEGQVIARSEVPILSSLQWQSVLEQFLGPSMQVPPMYSALKQNGQPLYKLARQGKTVERPARAIHIHTMTYHSHQQDQLRFSVRCSKGTYIRSLAEDIADRVGSHAHVTALRRTKVGDFSIEHAYTLDELGEKVANSVNFSLIPLDALVSTLPAVSIDPDQALALAQGRSVQVHEQGLAADVAVFTGHSFTGIGALEEGGVLRPKRMLSVV